MTQKTLVLHVPVIHKGYLNLFESRKKDIGEICIIGEDLLAELTKFKPNIASLSSETAKKLLEQLGFKHISTVSKENIGQALEGKNILLIQDEISRNLFEKYLKNQNVEWVSVFLRWDEKLVVAQTPVEGVSVSQNESDTKLMKEAYQEAQKSGDWWRQVGAVLVKDKKIVLRGYNQGVPNDHAPYQEGMVRDFFWAGEKQELANTIHAEPLLIAEAAKNGVPLEGASLYVTHFPCAVCAKFVAYSGIAKVYFCEGASTLDGQKVLESAGIELIRIAMV